MKWLDDIVDAVIRGVARFSRKRDEPRTPQPFGRRHLPRLDGACVYCGEPNVDQREMCPGPPARTRE